MIEFLFLDLDDTILDFHKAERIALSKTLRDFSLEPTEEVLARYHAINAQHWRRLERREIDRQEVLVGRFRVLFEELGMEIDAGAVMKAYEHNLSMGHYFLPGALDAVQRLHGKYRLFLASNGTAVVQHSRLQSAGLYPYFEQVFISQEVGFDKPSKEYFAACFAKIPGFRVGGAMMVGDSLTSDMLGGLNAGMHTCWITPASTPAREDIVPEYRLESLTQLEKLLETL